MSISSSLYAGISGLSTLGSAMSILGDNVANVNTIAYKSSRATFQDVLAQSVSTAAGSAQVGRGVTLSTVDGIFAQGSFESTSNPTDLAIGGQGFFMLRAADSAAAAMYTRAGEFRFDQLGNLINPVGYFVQGWAIDANGERQGTIGDINLGKSTPPVETQRVQAIVNLDSRVAKPLTTTRLFDAWNGTNAAAITFTPPIDPANYSYTSAMKVYDSQGASHDITVYFARTAAEDEWQFLVTSDPTEDMRNLSPEDQAIYSPNEQVNYQEHKGAGALMYGTINFTARGDIKEIAAWNVPPDGKVDPALNTNRILLDSTDRYYSFEANFTGAEENQRVEINLGAFYGGQEKLQHQVIVSDNTRDDGAFSNNSASAFINKETLLTDVYSKDGIRLGAGYEFVFEGYDHNGEVVGPHTYTIAANNKVSHFLEEIGGKFGAKATIDAVGRLQLTDNKGGASGLAVTSFEIWNGDPANPLSEKVTNPWGEQLKITTFKQQAVADARGVTSQPGADVQVITANTALTNVLDEAGNGFALNDEINFEGEKGSGISVTETFKVGTDFGPPLTEATGTVRDLLTWLEDKFDAVATIDGAGRLVLTDRVTGASELKVTKVEHVPVDPLAVASEAFGTDGTVTTFNIIAADSSEDGSRQGGTVSAGFVTEALSSTQYANASTTIFQDQDGYASGFLQSVSVDTDGVITGHFSNGQVLKKAQVALATFNNMAGLKKEGGNVFTHTTESGAPVTGAPRTNGLGSIAPNSLEQSNVDLGSEFVKLITTQRGFQASSKIITTTDEMLAELISIKR